MVALPERGGTWIELWRVGYTMQPTPRVAFIQGLLSDGTALPSLGRADDAQAVTEVPFPPPHTAVVGRQGRERRDAWRVAVHVRYGRAARHLLLPRRACQVPAM